MKRVKYSVIHCLQVWGLPLHRSGMEMSCHSPMKQLLVPTVEEQTAKIFTHQITKSLLDFKNASKKIYLEKFYNIL